MNINKKLGRMKQWAGEKMGGEIKTGVSDEFKALEVEMELRHAGMDKMQRSMTTYVKSMSKRAEGDDKEKSLPGGHLGSAMVTHSEDFEPDSEFGNCLASLGRANERLARVQETYVGSATSTWLEGLERSLAQMKEYQAARKKLEQRRLAYDTSLAKMQKAKKEDFRVEEELRAQKVKYEESSEDVFRRMQDIKEAEVDLVQDLTDFLEAELTYYDRCREILINVKRDWPVRDARRPTRSRSNTHTAHGYADRFNPPEEEPAPSPPRITIPRLPSRNFSPPESASPVTRPPYGRTNTGTYDSRSASTRDISPAPRISRVPTEPTAVLTSRANLRPVRKASYGANASANAFSDEYAEEYSSSGNGNGNGNGGGYGGDRGYGSRRDRSPPSPATSHGSEVSGSRGGYDNHRDAYNSMGTTPGKKAPPPPPPSRAKKPPPPPPPMKRSALSGSETAHY